MNMRFWGSTLARNVPAALDIYADIILRPHLPDEELEPVQALALQDIQSLEDAPQQKVMVELRRRYYPAPLNKDRRGKVEDIEALTIDARARALPPAVPPERGDPLGRREHRMGAAEGAGRAAVRRLEAGRRPGPDAASRTTPKSAAHRQGHAADADRASPSPASRSDHPHYYAARAAEGVLSGGMSARLFTEVREKRGLCYSVGVRHETFKDRGTMVGYAGTRRRPGPADARRDGRRAAPAQGRRRRTTRSTA